MALVYESNSGVSVATGTAAMWEIRSFLIARGWTSVKDSDGTTYSSSGAQLTGSGSGANGLGNTSAWFVLRSPTGTKEIAIQRGSTSLLWRCKVSPTGFSGGSPAATVMPTATDQGHLRGADTPTFVTVFPADGTYKIYGCADNATPYGFCFLGLTTGLAATGFVFCMDPMVNLPNGTDTDPYVYNLSLASGSGLPVFGASTGWMGLGTSGTPFVGYLNGSFVAMGALTPCVYNSAGSLREFGSQYGQYNQLTLDVILPFSYGRPTGETAPIGTKGVSYFFATGSGNRANGDTISDAGLTNNKDWLVIEKYLFKWNSTVPS